MRQRDFYNTMLELREYLDRKFNTADERITAEFGRVHDELSRINVRLDRIQEDIAGIKLEAATHRHDDD